MTKWQVAQAWEKDWWNNCINTYYEEMKQLVYAERMGLICTPDAKTRYRFDMEGKSVLDIGAGATSLLLKCVNVQGKIIDPLKFPDWVMQRYAAAGIVFERKKAEDMNIEEKFDECWIYNCLQHVEDPEKIIMNVRKSAKIIRIFEWIDTQPNEGHPRTLTEEKLNASFGGEGKVEMFTGQNGCKGRAYYGVFIGIAND